jgi:hypothetical protein
MARADAEVLSKRQLNRALLARQMLLDRESVAPLQAIEALFGMQAQIPRPPFVGLWARVKGFEREDLLRLLRDKKAVRATAMRGTIHLMSTNDFMRFRPVLAEMLARGAHSIVGKQLPGVDVKDVHKVGRDFFAKAPATFDDLRKHLEGTAYAAAVRAAAYTVRMGIPLVMVPEDVAWGWPASAQFALAEKWFGAKTAVKASAVDDLVLRYLSAFGPATPGDAQTWSGVRGLRETFERLRPKLVTFRDARKRELFDLPDAPRPDEDTGAPVRFLPEFDNALLAHDDRTRIIADEHRGAVFLKNLQVLGTFLVDGFVAGTWRVDRTKKEALLSLRPFGKIAKRVSTDLEDEGASLLRFLEPDAAHGVRFAI